MIGNDSAWNEPAGGWNLKPQPLVWPMHIGPVPTPTPTKPELYDSLASLGTIDDEDPQASIGDMKMARKIAARRRKAGWRG